MSGSGSKVGLRMLSVAIKLWLIWHLFVIGVLPAINSQILTQFHKPSMVGPSVFTVCALLITIVVNRHKFSAVAVLWYSGVIGMYGVLHFQTFPSAALLYFGLCVVAVILAAILWRCED